MIYIVINCLFIEEIQFKAPIPHQGILLIGDFRDNSKYYLKGFQPIKNNNNNTAISIIGI